MDTYLHNAGFAFRSFISVVSKGTDVGPLRKLVERKSSAGPIAAITSLSSHYSSVSDNFCHLLPEIAGIHIYVVYTPNLGSVIGVFVLGREHGRFRGSTKEAPREHRGRSLFGVLVLEGSQPTGA